jgi:hypothetical protein
MPTSTVLLGEAQARREIVRVISDPARRFERRAVAEPRVIEQLVSQPQ